MPDEDIARAVDGALTTKHAGEDPDRWMVLGPDRAANLLEVVVMMTVEATQIAIHAMPLRPKYWHLLGQGVDPTPSGTRRRAVRSRTSWWSSWPRRPSAATKWTS